jgi:hypothetical protein
VNLLVPAALGFAALAGPLLVLYMLRSRRRRVDVGSIRIWQPTAAQVTSAVPWSRLRWTSLLVLQLFIVGLFAFTLARPYLAQRTVLGPHAVFIIDTSGSMAEDDRIGEAKSEARSLAEDVSDGNLVSVIDAGPHPRVIVSQARSSETVMAAIDSLEAGGGEADLSEAIRLGRGLATPDRPTNLVIFSDGGESPLPEEPVLGATHVSFDSIARDVAIDALDVETTGGVTRALVSVVNHAASRTSAIVEVTVDGIPLREVEIELGPNERTVRSIELDAGSGAEVLIRRIGEADGNPLDDEVVTVIQAGQTRTVSVQGEGSPFLGALIGATPGFELAETDGDVLIVDRGPLPEIDRPTWIIRSETVPEGLELTGLVENIPATFQAPGEPVLDGVDLSEVVIAEAQTMTVIGWSPIVRSGDVPLVLLGSVNGQRVVYFTFDLTHSNLPVQLSFPILGAALVQWLDGDAPGTVETGAAGDPIPITAPSGSEVAITMPDGEERVFSSDTATFTDTAQPGVYRVAYRMEDGAVTQGPTAVRRFVATEAGAPVREIATTPTVAQADEPAFVVREWAAWLVSFLLSLLAVEWWVGHQRPLPRRATA